MQTRRQRFMKQALDRVGAVKGQSYQKIYGGLCHKIPVLVRTNGLCQTLAFVADKASGSGDRARAYQRLRVHIAEILATPVESLMDTVSQASVPRYVQYTRTLLDAWVYYKRFAVSILNVDAAQADREEDR